LDQFEHFRADLVRFCDATHLRDDLLGETNNDLIRTLELDSVNGTKFSKDQLDNLNSYLLLIPADLAYSFCKRVIDLNSKNPNLAHVRESIENCDELLKKVSSKGTAIKEKEEVAKSEGDVK
jgi:hypothetical protein